MKPGTRATSELVPLLTRVHFLVGFRLGVAALVLLARVTAPGLVGGDLGLLAGATGLFVAMIGLMEAIRRSVGRGLELLAFTLLLDGVYLAFVVAETGGADRSVLRLLIVIHLVAATLLVSYRTGLKVAVWHTILLAVSYELLANPGPLARSVAFGLAILLVGVGTATFSAVNERELRRRRADIEALHDFALALDEVRRPGEVAEVLADHAGSVLGLGARLVVGYRQGEAMLLAEQGTHVAEAGCAAQLGADSVVIEAWATRSPVLLRELDGAVDPWLAAAFAGLGNIVVVPFFTDGQPAGALVGAFENLSGNRVERTVVATGEQLAAHAGLALRNAWLLEDVEHLAVTDGLTRLANRRHLEGALEREMQVAAGNGGHVAFVLIDLDRFKVLNDVHGHLVGDDMLRRVGAVLARCGGPEDTVARYGGEEFALVLPGRDATSAAVVAERIRDGIERMEGPVHLTASFGVASYPQDGPDGASLVRAADDAMYESKRGGRNQVSVSSPRVAGWMELPWRSSAPAVASTLPDSAPWGSSATGSSRSTTT